MSIGLEVHCVSVQIPQTQRFPITMTIITPRDAERDGGEGGDIERGKKHQL